MKQLILIAFLIIALLLVSGCGRVSVADLNAEPEKYVGKKVVASGTVVAPMKLGVISGFTLKDGDASIIVSSDDVPDAKTEVTVKGTLVKGMMMPHYIYADKIVIE